MKKILNNYAYVAIVAIVAIIGLITAFSVPTMQNTDNNLAGNAFASKNTFASSNPISYGTVCVCNDGTYADPTCTPHNGCYGCCVMQGAKDGEWVNI